MDRQLTYYSNSHEYFFELTRPAVAPVPNPVSTPEPAPSTETGSLVETPHLPTATTAEQRFNKFNQNLWNNNGDGYIQVGAKDGPGMNLIFVYNSR